MEKLKIEAIKIDLMDYKQISIANHETNKVIAHMYLPNNIIEPVHEINAEIMADAFLSMRIT